MHHHSELGVSQRTRGFGRQNVECSSSGVKEANKLAGRERVFLYLQEAYALYSGVFHKPQGAPSTLVAVKESSCILKFSHCYITKNPS